MLNKLLLALACTLLLSSVATAQEGGEPVAYEEPSCDYCGQPLDTLTQVELALAVDGAADRYRFDSLWHAFEYIWHLAAEGSAVGVTMLAAQDYAAPLLDQPRWLLDSPEIGLSFVAVWTDDAFPGARKAPFIAMFGDRVDAIEFSEIYPGRVLTMDELYPELRARWDASHGPAGEELHHEHGHDDHDHEH